MSTTSQLQHTGSQIIWRCFFAIVVFLLALALCPAVSAIADDSNDNETEMDAKSLSKLSGEYAKQQFLAAKRVEAQNVQSSDDIFAAGRDLVFESVTAENIIAAGYALDFSRIAADDIIAAGAQIEMSGVVNDDVVAAVCPFCPFGGRLHIQDSARIGDDARLVGRDVAVDGAIGGDLFAAGDQVSIVGTVGGTATVEAKRIVVGQSARIGGDLVYAGSEKPEVAPGAVITGRVQKVEGRIPFSQVIPKHWTWYVLVSVLGTLLGLVLLGAVLHVIAPELVQNSAETARKTTLNSLGRGLVIAILAPGLIALLAITLVGMPIAIVLAAGFIVLLAFAYIVASYGVGRFARNIVNQKDSVEGLGARVLWTTVGILALFFVIAIPLIGGAIFILALTAALGAVARHLLPIVRKQPMRAAT